MSDSVALPKMSDELGFGPGVEGVVPAMFFAGYALCRLPVGHLVDRLGARSCSPSSGPGLLGASSYLVIVGRIEPLPPLKK